MWDFLKKILSSRDELTVMVLDEADPNESGSFRLQASDVVILALAVFVISVVLISIIFLVTPFGNHSDSALRDDVVSISNRVIALEDSLRARDEMLADMRNVLRTVPDTLFHVEQDELQQSSLRDVPAPAELPPSNAYEMLSQNELIFSARLDELPDFPSSFPMEGTLTQNYSSEAGHYGIDIAASPGIEFRALADGTVVNANWTINYGYVMYIQHSNGMMSIYKHGSNLLKQQGDFVLKGDIIGRIGGLGILSTGSHLHLEIWKNGVPQDPLMYLTK